MSEPSTVHVVSVVIWEGRRAPFLFFVYCFSLLSVHCWQTSSICVFLQNEQDIISSLSRYVHAPSSLQHGLASRCRRPMPAGEAKPCCREDGTLRFFYIMCWCKFSSEQNACHRCSAIHNVQVRENELAFLKRSLNYSYPAY